MIACFVKCKKCIHMNTENGFCKLDFCDYSPIPTTPKPKPKKEVYLVIVYEEYNKYQLIELFRQVVFSKEQLEIIQNNYDKVKYINLGDDEDE